MKILPPGYFSRHQPIVFRILLLSGIGIVGTLASELWATSLQDADLQVVFEESSHDANIRLDEIAECGLKLNANSVDFGTVFEGTKNTLTVKMRNNSNQIVDVISASASCGCTSVLTPTPFVMEAGAEKDLVIQLNTNNNIGDLKKVVTVFVHEGQRRLKFPISVKARSIPLVTIDQRRVDFGMVKKEDVEAEELTITLNHQQPLSSDAPTVYIAKVPIGIHAELNEVDAPVDAARQWKLKVSAKGHEIPEESIDSDLVIVTPSTVESVLRIPVLAKQHAYLNCEPGRVNFGVIRDESDTEQVIQLTGIQGHTHKVLSVEVAHGPSFLGAQYHAGSDSVSVMVDLKTAIKGFFKARVQIRFSCDNGPRQTLTVPVTGYRLNQ